MTVIYKPSIMKIQTILIPRSSYTLQDAIEWIYAHKFKPSFYGKQVEITSNHYRFRQSKPVGGAKYRTYTVPNSRGIKYVLIL